MLATLESALTDISGGLQRYRVWLALAKEDIGDQHRRTTLGPLWLLINYLAFASTFIFVFHNRGFDQSYAPYVALGLLSWLYMAEVIGQAVPLFSREKAFISGTTLPLFVYVMRLTMQSVIRGAYEIIGCLLLLALCRVSISLPALWSIVGVVVLLGVTPAAITIFAFLGAFFPDSQFIVSNLLRVGMFLSPVFWVHGHENKVQSIFYTWNPFTYFLEIVRDPILNHTFPQHAFIVCSVIGVILWIAALLVLGRYRREVVFVI